MSDIPWGELPAALTAFVAVVLLFFERIRDWRSGSPELRLVIKQIENSQNTLAWVQKQFDEALAQQKTQNSDKELATPDQLEELSVRVAELEQLLTQLLFDSAAIRDKSDETKV